MMATIIEVLSLLSIMAYRIHSFPHVESQGVLPYEEKFFTQYIDHFNYGGQAGPEGTYQERFLIQGRKIIHDLLVK